MRMRNVVLVNDLDLVNALVVRPYPRFDLRVEDTVDIPLRRLGIEIRAVVEFDALLQVEDIRSAVRPAPPMTSPDQARFLTLAVG